MKKLLLSLGAIAIGLTLFAGGIFAYQSLTFTGTEQAEQTNNNSSEMLEIIKKVAGERDVSKSELAQALEQANNLVSENGDLVSKNEDLQARVDKLEGMNPPGLVNQIKELKNTNTQLSEENEKLENNNTQLHDENEQLKNTNAQQFTDLNAKQKEINEKNQAYDNLQQERDGLSAEIDDLTAQLNEANNGTQADKDEIARLKAELIKANETMAEVNKQSNADVKEARTYK